MPCSSPEEDDNNGEMLSVASAFRLYTHGCGCTADRHHDACVLGTCPAVTSSDSAPNSAATIAVAPLLTPGNRCDSDILWCGGYAGFLEKLTVIHSIS